MEVNVFVVQNLAAQCIEIIVQSPIGAQCIEIIVQSPIGAQCIKIGMDLVPSIPDMLQVVESIRIW